MNRSFPWSATIAILMLHATVFAQGSRLQGTVHDFSELKGLDGGMRETDRCLVCHAVLQAMAVPVGAGMLWDRGQAQTTFTTYTFTDGSSAGQPTGSSKLCLGCHDGTVGVDEWDGRKGQHGQGIDLSRTHPISVPYRYDPADADGLNDPHATPMGSAGLIADFLPGGMVECVTCHDVHNQDAVEGTPMLRVSMSRSQGLASGLCLSCHRK